MSVILRVLAACLAACACVSAARAQVPLPVAVGQVSGPIFTPEQDGIEVALEWDGFVADGYEPVTWNGPRERRLDVLRKLVAPAHLSGTGDAVGDDAPFDFHLANVTGGEFNDIVVSSRLPGDCGPSGCRVMVFSTQDGNAWSQVADFTAMGVAFRRGGDGRRPSLAAVGDDVSPSFTLQWDGLSFKR